MAINYLGYQQTINPLQAALSGYESGSALGRQQVNQELSVQKFQQEQTVADQARQQAQAMQADLAAFAGKKDATASDYAEMAIKYPQLKDHFKQTYEMVAPEKQAAVRNQALSLFSALDAGQSDVAASMLERQIEAARNSGDEETAQAANAMLQLVKTNPEAAKASAGLSLSVTMGPKEFASTWEKLRTQERKDKLLPLEVEKKAADIGLTEAQVQTEIADLDRIAADISKTNAEADRVAADIKKMQLDMMKDRQNKGIELTSTGEKLVNEAVQNQLNLTSLANQYENLASEITNEINAGAVAGAEERVRKIFGAEDEVTRLRQEYRRLRNSQVLQSLPPGVASDKDIEIAMSAFPSDNANPELISSFLRGMSKLNRYDAALNGAKAEWVSQVGSLRPATKDVVVNGETVAKGTTFNRAMESIFEPVSITTPAATPEPSPAATAPTGQPSYLKYATGGQ